MVHRPSVVVRRPHFQTWIPLKPFGQSWSNFMCSITGVGTSCIRFWADWIKTLVSMATEGPHWLIMEKRYFQLFVVFDPILYILAGNEDMHKISDEFEFLPLILELLALEWRKSHTFELEYLWIQFAKLDQILCASSLGWGKGCIRFWGRLDQNSDLHGHRKPHWLIMGKMMSPAFLGCFLSDPFYTCR